MSWGKGEGELAEVSRWVTRSSRSSDHPSFLHSSTPYGKDEVDEWTAGRIGRKDETIRFARL